MADGYKEQVETRKRKKSTKRVLTEQKELTTTTAGALLADFDVFDALRDPAKLKVLHTELAKIKEEQLALEAEQKRVTAPMELVIILDCSSSITKDYYSLYGTEQDYSGNAEKIRAGFAEFFEYIDKDTIITLCTFGKRKNLQFFRKSPEDCKGFKYEIEDGTCFFDAAVPTLREVAAARESDGVEGPWLGLFITDQDIYQTAENGVSRVWELSKLKHRDLNATTEALKGTGLQTMMIAANGIDGKLIMEAVKFGVPGTRILKSGPTDFGEKMMIVLEAMDQVRYGRKEIELEQSLALTMGK